MFKLATTFENPSTTRSGMAVPGAGAQRVGNGTPRDVDIPWETMNVTPGTDTFQLSDNTRGFPAPEAPDQRKNPADLNYVPQASGEPEYKYYPYFSRGANAYAPQFGQVLSNPIGAGIVANHRPQAFYGGAGTYEHGSIWWTSQAIPTTINLQGLADSKALEAQLGEIYVEAVLPGQG
jgi:hypothetical protein